MKIMSSLCSVVRAPKPAEEGESKKKITAMLEETSSTNVEVFPGFLIPADREKASSPGGA